jgi:hypothetical protein
MCYHNARLLATFGHDYGLYSQDNGSIDQSLNGFIIKRLSYLFRIEMHLPAKLCLPRYDLIHLHYPFIFAK